MKRFLTLPVVLGAVVAAIVVGTLLIEAARLPCAPVGYCVQADFQTLPKDDKEFEEWLQKQPGVYIAQVQRTNNKVIIVWGNSQTSDRDPVTPNVRNEFEKHGYKGLTNYEESKGYSNR